MWPVLLFRFDKRHVTGVKIPVCGRSSKGRFEALRAKARL